MTPAAAITWTGDNLGEAFALWARAPRTHAIGFRREGERLAMSRCPWARAWRRSLNRKPGGPGTRSPLVDRD